MRKGKLEIVSIGRSKWSSSGRNIKKAPLSLFLFCMYETSSYLHTYRKFQWRGKIGEKREEIAKQNSVIEDEL